MIRSYYTAPRHARPPGRQGHPATVLLDPIRNTGYDNDTRRYPKRRDLAKYDMMPSSESLEHHSIHIGNVIRHACVFNFRKFHKDTMDTESLLQAVEQLFALLKARRIRYLLVGGIAILHYIQGRSTEDIDLIISTSSLQELPEINLISQDENFARGTFGTLQIDFLLTRNPLFAMVQHRYATTQPFQEHEILCATVAGLLLLKLYALPSLYRQGNFARVGLYENDIATLMHDYRPGMDVLVDELTSYLSPSDVGSLRDIVAEIQQRIERFQQGFGTQV